MPAAQRSEGPGPQQGRPQSAGPWPVQKGGAGKTAHGSDSKAFDKKDGTAFWRAKRVQNTEQDGKWRRLGCPSTDAVKDKGHPFSKRYGGF
ncbi:hypothetical protein GCM10010914_15950 [Deinococcus wulumuqiensis]|uniref:Uncharacterized protein n=1 Tax=Deinococcus wulumuqiensis TaxID=980427 RepID=A0AAV4K9S3_9DEIO|nr:hypothetical protein GCM10010914_15950 [Deinococcus wulumuqiensis]GGP29462.1 hypothetical protein GCM10008021_11130 [Deinococcus wulumuqiensis]